MAVDVRQGRRRRHGVVRCFSKLPGLLPDVPPFTCACQRAEEHGSDGRRDLLLPACPCQGLAQRAGERARARLAGRHAFSVAALPPCKLLPSPCLINPDLGPVNAYHHTFQAQSLGDNIPLSISMVCSPELSAFSGLDLALFHTSKYEEGSGEAL